MPVGALCITGAAAQSLLSCFDSPVRDSGAHVVAIYLFSRIPTGGMMSSAGYGVRHYFGTDSSGRCDPLVRVAIGGRISLMASTAAALVAVIAGTPRRRPAIWAAN